MTRFSHLMRACAAAAALSVAACANPVNGPEQSFDVNTRFPITVEPHMVALRLPYDAQGGLDQNMSDQLARFVADYIDHGSGAIAISAPRRYPNAPDFYAQRLVVLGVPRSRILVGNEDQQAAGDDVKITYIRYQAQTKPCGNWSENEGITAGNTVPPNFGCATQHNIAAMVADPRDLVAPQNQDPDDAQRRLSVLDKYRKGQATAAEKTQEQSAAISEVGGGK